MEYFMDFLRVMCAVTIVLGITFLVRFIKKKLGRIDSIFGNDFKKSLYQIEAPDLEG